KSLRALHSALGIVMAAVVLISITSSHIRQYEQALEELQTLKNLQWGDYADFCAKFLVKEFKQKYIEQTRDDYKSIFKDKDKIDMRDPVEVAVLPIVLIPPDRCTLASYRAFLSDNDEIGYYSPGQAEFIASIVVTDFDNPNRKPDWFLKTSTIHLVKSEL